MTTAQGRTVRIAIIGGGISGLAAAYYLQQRAARPGSGPRLDIHIFERKSLVGGNADTVVVRLGRYIGADGSPADYVRWADLGVNDANLATYHRMKAVMTEIGYLDQMKELQDTDCFYSDDGAALTDDAALRHGVSDPSFSLEEADGGQLVPLIKVMHKTALDLLGTIGLDYTCSRYFQDCLDDPRGMLSRAAEELKIPIAWSDPALIARITTVRDRYYYPRISAMYFTDDRGPQDMPLQAPFEYYRLQEGGVTPDRRYFAHGSQTWIEALSKHVREHSNDRVRVHLHCEAQARVRVGSRKVQVTAGRGAQPEDFDLCVLATHADDARAMLHFDDAVGGTGERLDDILAGVRYTRSYAVCHTASSAMPENKNSWRTYNIPIRSPRDSLFPYRINYVVNLHQNDVVPGSPYNAAGLPQYFVSLTDDLNNIPRQDMLDRVLEHQEVPAGLLGALPQSTRSQLRGAAVATGYRHELPHLEEQLGDKAWTMFKHNVLDADCIRAQQAMLQWNEETATALLHGSTPTVPLLFGGGWTLGAGLQEQCLEQGEKLAGWILPQ